MTDGDDGAARDDDFAATQALQMLDLALATGDLAISVGSGQQSCIVGERRCSVKQQRKVTFAQAALPHARLGVACDSEGGHSVFPKFSSMAACSTCRRSSWARISGGICSMSHWTRSTVFSLSFNSSGIA